MARVIEKRSFDHRAAEERLARKLNLAAVRALSRPLSGSLLRAQDLEQSRRMVRDDPIDAKL
jgi:hypothetical protein